MSLFSPADLIALFWFLAAWIGYSAVIEMTPRGKSGLNGLMHRYRSLWMERMLARAFKKLGVKSTDVIIATKIGHFPGTAEHAYEPAHIRHQCEQSLVNLGRDYIDLYYFHHGNFGENDRYLSEAAATLEVSDATIEIDSQFARARLRGQRGGTSG